MLLFANKDKVVKPKEEKVKTKNEDTQQVEDLTEDEETLLLIEFEAAFAE